MNALWAAAAALAAAGAYPASLDPQTLAAWLRQSAQITPEQVVAVSPSAATAILDRLPTAGGRIEAWLQALALTPQAASRGGAAAWEMRLEVDCRTGQVRPGATTGFPTRSSRADGVEMAPAETVWRRPKPGTTLESAWRAVCDARFRPPLAAESPRLAQAPRPGLGPAARARASVAPAASAAGTEAVARAPTNAPPVRRGPGAVQVVSSPVEADTRQALARLRQRFGAALEGRATRIEPAQVGGRAVYRGVIGGFASRSEAQAFCQTLRQHGQDCLAR